MTKDLYFFKTQMPATRKADYYLGCRDSSVFLDFNRTVDNRISLVRVSFDGYGCCSLENPEVLSYLESIIFIEEIKRVKMNQEKITALVKKIIMINKKNVWNDALIEYRLIACE